MASIDKFTDQEIMAKTLYGEGRGEGNIGMQAVANVVMNRVNSGIKWWGHDVRSVCLKPYQFSCWLEHDPNFPIIMEATEEDPIYASTMDISRRAMDGVLPDITGGAVQYYATSMRHPPEWAEGKIANIEIGNHLFFS